MHIWRISNYADLRGLGGLRAAGRWHYRGRPVVYAADHPAAALLEVLVHLEFGDPADLPDSYQLLRIEVPADVPTATLAAGQLSADWRERPALTQELGSQWLAEGGTALLTVPNAIVPYATHVLINPLHPNAARLRIEAAERYPFDDRLFGPAPQRPGA